MDKSSARRRPNNSASGQQQQLPTTTATSTLHTKRTAGRSKCVGKASAGKDRANAVLAMVQPTNNSNNNNNNNNSNSNYSRCSSGRERETARTALPTMTRIGFGRSVTSSAAGSAAPSGSGARKGCATTPPAHLKPMAEAHKQLELMLARIERGSDFMAAAPRRRKLQSAKLARSQGEPPQPPVPTVTPLSSARRRRYEGGMEDGVGVGVGAAGGAGAAHPIEYKLATTLTMAGGTTTTTTTMSTIVTGNPPVLVPLAQNPQRLTPENRVALLKLLSRVEQRDQEMVQVLLSELNAAAGDAAATDGGMCRTHQRLPLSVNAADSPYCDSYCMVGAGSGYRRERQRSEDEPRYREMRTVQGAANDSNSFLEDVLREEKQIMDLMDEEIYRKQLAAMSPAQRQRQQQTMDERLELDKQKQQVAECRVKHQQKRLKREKQHLAAQLIKKAKRARQVLEQRNEQFESDPDFQMPQLPKETVHIVPTREAWRRRLQRQKEEKAEQEEEQQGEEEQYHNEDEDDEEYGLVNSHSGEGDNHGLPSPAAISVELNELFMQRLSFQAQCGRSNLYNNCQLFSNISNTLSDELINSMDAELRRNLSEQPQQLADQEQ